MNEPAAAVRKRNIRNCRKCSGHGIVSPLLFFHTAASCPFRECTCKGCIKVEKARENSRKNHRLFQIRENERRRASAAVGNPAETAPPLGSGLTVVPVLTLSDDDDDGDGPRPEDSLCRQFVVTEPTRLLGPDSCKLCRRHKSTAARGHPGQRCPFATCRCPRCRARLRLNEIRRRWALTASTASAVKPWRPWRHRAAGGQHAGVTRPQPGAPDAQRGGGVADAAAPAADAMNRVTAEADGAVRRPRPEQRPSEREMPTPSAPPRNNAHHTEDEPDVQQPVKQPVKQTLLHRLLQQPKLEQRDVQEPAQPPAEDPTLDLAMQTLCIKCSATVATEAELQDHVDVVHMELVPLLRVNHIFELMKEAERQRSLCDASEMPEVKGA